jgi:hypothetical protein
MFGQRALEVQVSALAVVVYPATRRALISWRSSVSLNEWGRAASSVPDPMPVQPALTIWTARAFTTSRSRRLPATKVKSSNQPSGDQRRRFTRSTARSSASLTDRS